MTNNTLDYLNFQNNVITLFYSLTVSILCIAGLYYESISYMPYITFLSILFLVFTTLQYFHTIDNIFIIHHLSTMYLILYVYFSNDSSLILLSYIFYLSHITGVFSSIKYICKSNVLQYKELQCYQSIQFINNFSNNKQIQIINENLFIISFAVVRVFLFAPYSYIYVHKNFGKINFLFVICILILNILQIYWFSRIVEKTYNKILNEQS